jgi:hypothetical protein
VRTCTITVTPRPSASGSTSANPGGDHAGVLEDLHPPPDGRGREPDMLGELTGRHRRIRLQKTHDFPIDLIQIQ